MTTLSVRKLHNDNSGNIEYFMRDSNVPSSKVMWLCMDTLKEDEIKMWVSIFGVYPIPESAIESNFLDILVISGLSKALLESLYSEMTFGTLVSFSQGKVHKKDHLFNVDTLKDLIN